ncbi:C2 calcium-dependent membrane-targeting protein [Tanacetum coccineum]
MLRWLIVRKMGGAYFISDSDLFESFGPQEPVDNDVLSSWSAYMNFLEGKKDKNSPTRLFLPTFEVVFIRVSNNQHQFLLCVNMKNPVVSFIDSKKQVKKVARKKKKVEDIDDIRVASILWQTDKRAKDCGIFLMRHMEAYMGNELGNWKCGLADEGRK